MKQWIILGIAAVTAFVVATSICSLLYTPAPASYYATQAVEYEPETVSPRDVVTQSGQTLASREASKIFKKDSGEVQYRGFELYEKPTLDRWLTYATVYLAVFTFFLFVGTGILAAYTYGLWTDAKDTSKNSRADMQASIAEAARATNAMTTIATATRDNAVLMQGILHQQMRAYIAVEHGVPTCQDGALRFAAAPIITNAGLTPARNVCHKYQVAILDLGDAAADYEFDSTATWNISDNVLSPRQSFVINAIVKEREPDEDVPEIMKGNRKRLFVWGQVSYDDVFGKKWETKFCHNFIFFKDEKETIKFLGFYYRTHNSAI